MTEGHNGDDQVLFAKGLRHEEALVLIGALEANGVEAFLKTENLGMHVPGGVNNYIFVAEKDLERAKQVKESFSEETRAFGKKTVPSSRAWILGKRAFFVGAWIISLIVVAGVSQRAAKKDEVQAKRGPLQTSQLTGKNFYEEDLDKDGRLDTQHYVDKEGRPLESKTDRNGDGRPDLVRTYHFDGYVVREEQDTDYDGKMDRWDDLDSEGTTIHARYDLNHDGEPDSESWHNENGALEKTVTTRKGRVAEETHYENDLATRSFVDLDHDGTLDTEVVYDELGIFKEARKLKAE